MWGGESVFQTHIHTSLKIPRAKNKTVLESSGDPDSESKLFQFGCDTLTNHFVNSQNHIDHPVLLYLVQKNLINPQEKERRRKTCSQALITTNSDNYLRLLTNGGDEKQEHKGTLLSSFSKIKKTKYLYFNDTYGGQMMI